VAVRVGDPEIPRLIGGNAGGCRKARGRVLDRYCPGSWRGGEDRLKGPVASASLLSAAAFLLGIVRDVEGSGDNVGRLGARGGNSQREEVAARRAITRFATSCGVDAGRDYVGEGVEFGCGNEGAGKVGLGR